MISTSFDYEKPQTLEAALSLLVEHGDDAKLLAGGHSLIPLMKLRLSEPKILIDIASIPELHGITADENVITIGAATTHTEIASSDLLKKKAIILAETAGGIGDVQVRNHGTIGGSLSHADPAADFPAVMIALNATIIIVGPSGERRVNAEDFFQDFLTVDIASNEILIAVEFEENLIAAYAKLPQRASRYALVGTAVSLTITNQKCTAVRVAITGASSHARRLPAVENALINNILNPETIAAACEISGNELSRVSDDIHGSEEYRRAMIKVFTKRALLLALQRAN
tara:strand:+ start:4216 stop:5073 length:858 start_codon:yes stop_codon:yes gene_type:complete